MIAHVLSILTFMVVTFAAQGLSHFVINKDHFDSVGFLRSEPIMAMGFVVMIIQGLIISIGLKAWKDSTVRMKDGVIISLLFGSFLVSYIALTEPAKYTVPSISNWILIELTVGLLQFGIFGLTLGWIHKKFRSDNRHRNTYTNKI
ncbi:hypothetical protein [Vibrio penaeicida]|uniref:Uncharacterized protein n=1 Tax=Vibrio penaeicida TaxID=104609 RepID=A0AAV5NY31_9VIBR|nr:hypothetical protein [Vibrio penaeicida]RTZ21765.1 hypothetical protein EKN09_17560 [Vibrio penaeicida]GLQ75630.1 hypothetical protein GCM10007932_49920 [Vibrio penaeicida]